jgi:hypothetical protein
MIIQEAYTKTTGTLIMLIIADFRRYIEKIRVNPCPIKNKIIRSNITARSIS